MTNGSDDKRVPVQVAYTAAVDCFLREHDRWNHWMLFFFGIIASIFIAWQQLRAAVPLWVACFVASEVAGLWVMAAVNIRISAITWFEIARRLELGTAETAFVEQQREFESYSRWEDYKATFRLFSRTPWHSLTRILVLLASLIALSLLFLGFGLLSGMLEVA